MDDTGRAGAPGDAFFVRWIRHIVKTEQVMLQYLVGWTDQVGNHAADRLANRGAHMNEVLPGEAESYWELQDKV